MGRHHRKNRTRTPSTLEKKTSSEKTVSKNKYYWLLTAYILLAFGYITPIILTMIAPLTLYAVFIFATMSFFSLSMMLATLIKTVGSKIKHSARIALHNIKHYARLIVRRLSWHTIHDNHETSSADGD